MFNFKLENRETVISPPLPVTLQETDGIAVASMGTIGSTGGGDR